MREGIIREIVHRPKMDLMPERRISSERIDILADVAEMYYLESMNQAQIAKQVGVTRSMVSRMLSDARRLGIVDIKINRPLQFNEEMERALIARFGLKDACVIQRRIENESRLVLRLGYAGAIALMHYLKPNSILGLAWGTGVSAAVEALEVQEPIPLKVVQLVGALGARNQAYDAHTIVQRLAEKLGGEGLYLNAPFIVDSPEIVQALKVNPGVVETFSLIRRCDVALIGVGSIDPEYSSFYHAGYVKKATLEELTRAGAVGDVCGRHFDIHGNLLDIDFNRQLVSIDTQDLLRIPVRIAVAGGSGKVAPILGALRGRLVNVVVTDSLTAREVLRRDDEERQAV